VYLDDGRYFNQVGFEAGADSPGALFSFLGKGDDLHDLVRVERRVTETHATLYFPLAQEIEVEAAYSTSFRLTGHAIAASPIVAWPHAFAYDSVYRWESDTGAVGFGPCQGIWFEAYQHAMKQRRS
jgi:hypothetical protein